jgi:hypothetical protein
MKVNILGAEYDYEIVSDGEDKTLEDNNGYCDEHAKIIRIDGGYNEKHSMSTKNMGEFMRKVKRHELVHAYMCESGLREWADNELLVDWIAAQFPKMSETFWELDCL